MTPVELESILKRIAAEHLSIDTLDVRSCDRLDFHDVAVWNIRSALEAAFEAGRKAERNARE